MDQNLAQEEDFVLFDKYYDDQITEHEMGGKHRPHGRMKMHTTF
jgi:hypothetical protein